MSHIKDRRETGIHRTLISDGNGGRLDLITVTARRVRVIGMAVLTLFGVLGAIFGAVRMGVVSEVHAAVEAEARDESGIIHQQIHECAEKYIDDVQEVIQEDFEVFDGRLKKVEVVGIQLTSGQEAISAQQARNQEELKMLLERAIANGGAG